VLGKNKAIKIIRKNRHRDKKVEKDADVKNTSDDAEIILF
jgi:hypothetical protein